MSKARFERDSDKDLKNQRKHGVSFAMAQFAFADSRRVTKEDVRRAVQSLPAGSAGP